MDAEQQRLAEKMAGGTASAQDLIRLGLMNKPLGGSSPPPPPAAGKQAEEKLSADALILKGLSGGH